MTLTNTTQVTSSTTNDLRVSLRTPLVYLVGLRESLKFARNILILEHIFKEMFIIDGFEPIKYPIIVFLVKGDNCS